MKLELLFLSCLNTCTQSYKISLIYLSSFHIVCCLRLAPQNTKSPAIQETQQMCRQHFPAGISASHSVGLCLSVMWKACHRLTFQLMLQPSYIRNKQFLYCYFLTWISQMVHMNLARFSLLKFLKTWYFYPWWYKFINVFEDSALSIM